MQKFACKTVKILYAVLMAAILGVLILYSKGNYFGIYCNFAIKNAPLLAMGVLLSAIVYGLRYYVLDGRIVKKEYPVDKWVRTICFVLFIFQAYASYNILVYPGWDAGGCLRDGGIIVYNYLDIYRDFLSSGWSRYPNNILMVITDTFFLWINRNFGIFSGEQTQMCIALVTCLLNTLTCLLVYKTARLYLRKSYAFAGFLLVVMSIGLNPTFSFMYTDAFGVIFPILVFYLYQKPELAVRKQWMNRIIAMILGAVGFRFKPQCGIVVIALMIMELVQCFGDEWKTHVRRMLVNILSLIVAFGMLAILMNGFCNRFGIEVDDQQSFGPAHFFMMGLNDGNDGGYSQEDVDFSGSFATKAERNSADLQRAVERLKEFGPVGLAKHTIKKINKVWGRGIFGWGIANSTSIPKSPNKVAAPFFRSWYYDNAEGTRYEYFGRFEQLVWLMILLYAFTAVWKRPEKMEPLAQCALLLAIVGLILFELIFEAHSRYVYTSVPLLALLAAVGMQGIGDAVAGRKERL